MLEQLLERGGEVGHADVKRYESEQNGHRKADHDQVELRRDAAEHAEGDIGDQQGRHGRQREHDACREDDASGTGDIVPAGFRDRQKLDRQESEALYQG